MIQYRKGVYQNSTLKNKMISYNTTLFWDIQFPKGIAVKPAVKKHDIYVKNIFTN